MSTELSEDDMKNLQLQVAAFGSFKCFACATIPVYWQAVGAIKLAKDAGLIPDGGNCKELLRDGGKLADVLSKVVPGQVGLISAIVKLGADLCGDCACDQVF